MAEKHGHLKEEAKKVSSTFSTVLTLFSKCHHGYNSGSVTDTAIEGIGKWHYNRVIDMIYLDSCRQGHKSLHGILQEDFPHHHGPSQDAHLGGPHGTVVETVAHRFRADGGARG